MWKKRHLERFKSGFIEKSPKTNHTEVQTFTACNVCCKEVLVTDKVVRVKVERCDFKDYFDKKREKENKRTKAVGKKVILKTSRNHNGAYKNSKKPKRLKKNAKFSKAAKPNKRFTRSTGTPELLNKRVPKANLKYSDFFTTLANIGTEKSTTPVKKSTNNLRNSQVSDKKNNNLKMMEMEEEKFQTMYVLNVNFWRCGRPKKLKRIMEFPALVKKLKQIKLPSADWKIEIIITNKVINQVVFVNKKCDRCIKFYRLHSAIDIMMNDTRVSLLGAPQSLQTLEDVAVLLDIVHFIREDDPIVKFEKAK